MTRANLLRLANSIPPTMAEVIENVGFLASHGVQPDEIARRLHTEREALAARCRRGGALALATYMAPSTPWVPEVRDGAA